MASSGPSRFSRQDAAPHPESQRTSEFHASMERWSLARWTAEFGPMLVDDIDEVGRRSLQDRSDRGLHRHGFVYRGRFRSTGLAEGFSNFLPFRAGQESDAVVRLSAFHSQMARDDAPVTDVLGMAVKLVAPLAAEERGDPVGPEVPRSLPGAGEASDFVAMTADVFPVRTSLQFHRLLQVLARKHWFNSFRGLLC
jgi:hypothetical protein